MKRITLSLLGAALLLVAACAPERSPESVLPAFYQNANQWIQNPAKQDLALEACDFLEEQALRSYPGDYVKRCQAALRSSFTTRSGDVFRVEAIREGSWVRTEGERVRLQPLVFFIRSQSQETVLQGEAAAVLSPENNWRIKSVAGLSASAALGESGFGSLQAALLAQRG